MWSLKAFVWLLALLTLSGLALVFFYVPQAVAPTTVGQVRPGATPGGVFRGLHFWTAQLLVLTVLVHLARSVFVRTNRPRVGWAIVLATLTGFFWFTGILLPWDQLTDWMLSWTRGAGGFLGRADPQGILLTVYWTHALALFLMTLPLLIAYARWTRRNFAATL